MAGCRDRMDPRAGAPHTERGASHGLDRPTWTPRAHRARSCRRRLVPYRPRRGDSGREDRRRRPRIVTAARRSAVPGAGQPVHTRSLLPRRGAGVGEGPDGTCRVPAHDRDRGDPAARARASRRRSRSVSRGSTTSACSSPASGETIDLSSGGCRVKVDSPLPNNGPATLMVPVADGVPIVALAVDQGRGAAAAIVGVPVVVPAHHRRRRRPPGRAGLSESYARRPGGCAVKKRQMVAVASNASLGGSSTRARRCPPGHEWPPSAIVTSSTSTPGAQPGPAFGRDAAVRRRLRRRSAPGSRLRWRSAARRRVRGGTTAGCAGTTSSGSRRRTVRCRPRGRGCAATRPDARARSRRT